MPLDLPFRSALDLAAAIRARQVGCRELLDLFVARTERLDPRINAVVVRDFDRARVRADAADSALARGESWGPLHGVPMTVKESLDLEGLPTTWGLPEYRGHRAVQRVATAAVVLDRPAWRHRRRGGRTTNERVPVKPWSRISRHKRD